MNLMADKNLKSTFAITVIILGMMIFICHGKLENLYIQIFRYICIYKFYMKTEICDIKQVHNIIFIYNSLIRFTKE